MTGTNPRVLGIFLGLTACLLLCASCGGGKPSTVSQPVTGTGLTTVSLGDEVTPAVSVTLAPTATSAVEECPFMGPTADVVLHTEDGCLYFLHKSGEYLAETTGEGDLDSYLSHKVRFSPMVRDYLTSIKVNPCGVIWWGLDVGVAVVHVTDKLTDGCVDYQH